MGCGMKARRKELIVIELTRGDAAKIMGEIMLVANFLEDGPLGDEALKNCEMLCDKIFKSGGEDVA